MASLEWILVGLIVAFCALFSLWRLLPVSTRMRALERLGTRIDPDGRGWIGRWLAHKRRIASGCGACSQATRAVNPAAPASNRTPAAPRR